MTKQASLTKTPENKGKESVGAKAKNNFYESMDSPVEQIFHLQRTVGNQAVQRLLKSGTLQAKLKIGQPNDQYEQEADRVADQVMRMPEPGGGLDSGHWSLAQRKSGCSGCPEEEEIQTKPLAAQITPFVQRQVDEEEEGLDKMKLLQRHETEEEEPLQAKQGPNQAPMVSSHIESSVNSLKGGGQPLLESTRTYFEPRFGADFRHVRVHTGSQAAETAKSINAKAFTSGKDVVFGIGQYSPGTSSGKRLLAHELTHVVQQEGEHDLWKSGYPPEIFQTMRKSFTDSPQSNRSLSPFISNSVNKNQIDRDVPNLQANYLDEPMLIHGSDDALRNDIEINLGRWESGAIDGVRNFIEDHLKQVIDDLEAGELADLLLSLVGNIIWAAATFAQPGLVAFGISLIGIALAASANIPSQSSNILNVTFIRDFLVKYFYLAYTLIKNVLPEKAKEYVRINPGVIGKHALEEFLRAIFKPSIIILGSIPQIDREKVASITENTATAILNHLKYFKGLPSYKEIKGEWKSSMTPFFLKLLSFQLDKELAPHRRGILEYQVRNPQYGVLVAIYMRYRKYQLGICTSVSREFNSISVFYSECQTIEEAIAKWESLYPPHEVINPWNIYINYHWIPPLDVEIFGGTRSYLFESNKLNFEFELNTKDKLRIFLKEDQEKEAIDLMSRLSPEEVEFVLSNHAFKQLAINAFDDIQMFSAIYKMRGDLYKSLEWMFDNGTKFGLVYLVIYSAPSGHDKVRSDNRMKNNFAKICSIEEMYLAVNLLGCTLLQKLAWMKAVADVSWIGIGSHFPLVANMISSANPQERLALYNESFVMDFFKYNCNEAQISNVVDLLGGTLLQKLRMMVTVGTNYGFLRQKVITSPIAERTSVLANQDFLRLMLSNLGGPFGWDDFARIVELLGRRAPSGNEMLEDPIVYYGMLKAYIKTNEFQITHQIMPGFSWENRGWIYLNLIDSSLYTRLAHSCILCGCFNLLDDPPIESDSIVVGAFHARPFEKDWDQIPSSDDTNWANQNGAPLFVIGARDFPVLSNLILSTTGPLYRYHLAGGRGFPGPGGGLAP